MRYTIENAAAIWGRNGPVSNGDSQIHVKNIGGEKAYEYYNEGFFADAVW